MRLLEKAPAARFQSAADLAWVLARVPRAAVGSVPQQPASQLGDPSSAVVLWRERSSCWTPTAIGALGSPSATHRSRIAARHRHAADQRWLARDFARRLKVVFAARSEGQSQLWVRALDSSEAQPLPGTERASSPFWSPDSRSLAFFADARLKRMDLADGSVRTLAIAPAPLGGAWGRDGTILFSTNPGNPIFRIAAGGGDTRRGDTIRVVAAKLSILPVVSSRWSALSLLRERST